MQRSTNSVFIWNRARFAFRESNCLCRGREGCAPAINCKEGWPKAGVVPLLLFIARQPIPELRSNTAFFLLCSSQFQDLADFGMFAPYRQQQWSGAIHLSGIEICASFNQDSNSLGMPEPDRVRQWEARVPVPDVNIYSLIE